MSLLRAFSPAARFLAGLALALFVAFALRAAGFLGVSEDDPSRTLLAWDFAHHPRLDATRSSWLPAPTWLLGAALRLTGELVFTPSLPAVLSLAGLVAVLLSLGPRSLGPLLAALLFPWTLLCTAAPGVPEVPTTALLLGGVHLLLAQRLSPRRALAGSALLALACLCRYEAWFAVAGLGAALLPSRSRGPWRALPLLALALVVLAWMALNRARTGDALDFVHRVERYRRSLGALPPWPSRLASLGALFLPLALPLALALPWVSLPRAAGPVLAGALAVLGGLLLTELRGGGATHHADRSLLPVQWLLAYALALGSPRSRAREALLALCLALSVGTSARRTREAWPVVDEGARAAGALLAASRPRCYALELGRLDFLWVELLSGSPDAARPDRPFGAPSPGPEVLLRASAGCELAALHSPEAARALENAGAQRVLRSASWSVYRVGAAR